MDSSNIWYKFDLHGYKVNALLFLLCFLLLPTLASAQMNRADHDNKKVYFGVMMGFNNSNFRIEHSQDFLNHDSILVVNSPKGPGFNLGIVSNLRLNKHFDLRFVPGVAFSTRRLEYQQINELMVNKEIESVLLQFPLSLKFKSDRYNNFRFYVLGGPRLDYDLASNSKKRKAFDIVKLGRFDYTIDYGLGVQFFFPMFILAPEVSISQGIPNLHVPTEQLQFSNVLDKLFSRTIMFKLQFEG